MGYTPHVVVAGGGLVGTAIARDLAIRGLEVTLLEPGNHLSSPVEGASGLLASGAHLAVEQPSLARTHHSETRILHDIAGHYVEEVEELLCADSADESTSLDELFSALADIDLEAKRLSGAELRDREPALAEDVDGGLLAPAGRIDPVQLCRATAADAQEYGASVHARTELTAVTATDGRLERVRVKQRPKGVARGTAERTTLEPDYLVNAQPGAVQSVTDLAQLTAPGEVQQQAAGVVDLQQLSTVCRRCRPPGVPNTVVPTGSTAVLGPITTEGDGKPDQAAVDTLFEDLGALVPLVDDVRPLRLATSERLVPSETGTGPAPARVIDHDETDECWGVASVVGGTLTTHRKTAKVVADHVCGAFGIDRPCLTDELALPRIEPERPERPARDPTSGPHRPIYQPSDDVDPKTLDVLDYPYVNPVLCPCEGITRADVHEVLYDAEPLPGPDLHAVRTRTGAAAGTCQGCHCAHPLSTELSGSFDLNTVDRSVPDLLAERWAGQRLLPWGDSLAQLAETYELFVGQMSWHRGPDLDGEAVDWDAYDDGPPDATDTPDVVGGADD